MGELPFFSLYAIITYIFVLFSVVLGFIFAPRPVRKHKKKFFLKSVIFYSLFTMSFFLYEEGLGQIGVMIVSARTFLIFFPIFALILFFL